jgi:uncharacterized protein YyaL (SSP411 family)
MLALAYTEAYHATREVRFRDTAEKVFRYVLRDLRDPSGAFYTSESAESSGIEGEYYLWTEREIRDVLPPDNAAFAARVFSLDPRGNFQGEASGRRNGANVLHLSNTEKSLAGELGLDADGFASRLDAVRERLFQARNLRERPARDEKILTDLNGLMIAALAYGGRVFERDDLTAAAREALHWIDTAMRTPDGFPLHRYYRGESGIPGTLDDAAFLAWGCIELYQTTYDPAYLERAIELTGTVSGSFRDSTGGGFFSTAESDASVPRRKETFDTALPSGYSIAALNLVRLARLTGNPALEREAMDSCRAVTELVNRSPSAHSMLMVAADLLFHSSSEVVVAGNTGAPDTERLIAALRRAYLPFTVSLFRPVGEPVAIDRLSPALAGFGSGDGRARAFVCRNYTCAEPTPDPEQMIALLRTEP